MEAFLKHAHKKHSAKHITFNVIVVEASPHLGGHEMALSLSDDGIPTTIIPGMWLPHMMASSKYARKACIRKEWALDGMECKLKSSG